MRKPELHMASLNPEQSWLKEKPELAQDSELLTPDDWAAIEELVIKMLEEKQANRDELLYKSYQIGGTR